MFVYSKRIIQFIREIRLTIRQVLSQEIGLKVGRDRFQDQRGWASYPIKVVIFNNKNMLGYFDSSFYELGFHECLMHASKEQLHQVIRHELAHYLTFIKHGETTQPHGNEFRAFCQRMGWGEEVYRATLCLEGGQPVSGVEGSSIFRKVQKLMALSTSSNKNEAELAMIKSQQLLLKHNIESTYIPGEGDDKVILKRIMQQKREDAKMRSIARILETFFVSTVYNRAGGFIYLEILGDPVSVEIAEYVAAVLQVELDALWSQAQQQAHLKGMVARNSFFSGLAKGYCNKIQALKREYESDVAHALMVIEKKLVDARAMAYGRLSSAKSSGSYCSKSSALGEKMGKLLNINPAVNKSSTRPQALIGG